MTTEITDRSNYVQMPQDDKAQIEQVTRDYETEPAKGLVHGVQKDAIQNGFGARAVRKEGAACKDWRFTFELKQINGKNALVFWDEGTTGLTGEILRPDQIQRRIGEESLGPEERLSRFLARFVSGENLGPGSFGRGKLIFHGASKTTSILVDSHRMDDDLYIAFDRRVEGGVLIQPPVPYQGEEAKNFIFSNTGGLLQPLEKPGTRITILDVEAELAVAVKHSFSKSQYTYNRSLAHMIEETWWEIIHKFDAQIYIKYGDQALRVKLSEPLSTIVSAEDGQNGVRVHKKTTVTLGVAGEQYRIKEMKFVVLPGNINEEYREVWLQRKRMKIGDISKHFEIHSKIAKKFAGYVVLEPELEDLVELAEGTTHYSFDLRASGVKQIRTLLRAELHEFQRRLGLEAGSEDAASRQRLMDSMKELNELAAELGLVTNENVGPDRPQVDIMVTSFTLPNPDTLRVEIGDEVGPIEYRVRNNKATQSIGTFKVVANQRNREDVTIFSEDKNLGGNEQIEISVPSFIINNDRFEIGEPLNIGASYIEVDSGKKLATSTKRLYVGTAPPEPNTPPVKLSVRCRFPRRDTRRVEMTDIISNIRIKVTNTRAYDLCVDIDTSVRHLANKETGRLTVPLFSLFSEKELALKGQADYEFYLDDLPITMENFGSVHETIAAISERTCDIYTLVRLARASEELKKPRKWKLNKVSIAFFLEVDPPGNSIFQETLEYDDPTDGKQSWYDSMEDGGYRFLLNVGHGAYRFFQSRDDIAISKYYDQEQMLKQAYLIALEQEQYRGPSEPYEESLKDSSLPNHEMAGIYNTIIGTAINQIRG